MIKRTRLMQRLLVLWRKTGQSGAKLRIKQFFEVVWLSGTKELSPGEYWVYDLHMQAKNNAAIESYLPSKVYFSSVLPKLNNKLVISYLQNKWLFFLHFKEQGLPTPSCFGIFHHKSGFLKGGNPLREADFLTFISENELASFIVKPIAGTSGKDVHRVIVSQTETGQYFFIKDRRFGINGLFTFLSERIIATKNCGFLIQEFIEQHPQLAVISPSAAMNIRIVTLMRPTGDVVVTSASTRIGRAGSVVSNAGSGGLLAKLDLDTGVIVRCRSNAYIDAIEMNRHPDTQNQIVGEKIPFWQESLDLCCQAARLIPEANSIGWDVLVTSNGPILLEGNHDWDVISEQLFGEGYLTESNIKLFKEYGLEFSKARATNFRLKKFFQFLR
jgi:hypothetical protein